MPALVAILLVLALGIFVLMRLRGSAGPETALADATREERQAARRLGFAPRPCADPVEAIEDPRLAAMGIVAAIGEIDGQLTRDELEQMSVEAQVTFNIDRSTAESLLILAVWLLARAPDRMEFVARLAGIVAAKAGGRAAPDLLRMAAAAAAYAGPIGAEEEAALDIIRQAFGVNV